MNRILNSVAVGLLLLTASCQAIPQQRPAEKVEAPAEKAAERTPMQADLDDFAATFASSDEKEDDVEEYKAAILDFVACANQDEEYLEIIADLPPGQQSAANWTVLMFYMVFSQMDFTFTETDDSVTEGPADDSGEVEQMNMYESLVESVELCKAELE